jgi:hypothetical protein
LTFSVPFEPATVTVTAPMPAVMPAMLSTVPMFSVAAVSVKLKAAFVVDPDRFATLLLAFSVTPPAPWAATLVTVSVLAPWVIVPPVTRDNVFVPVGLIAAETVIPPVFVGSPTRMVPAVISFSSALVIPSVPAAFAPPRLIAVAGVRAVTVTIPVLALTVPFVVSMLRLSPVMVALPPPVVTFPFERLTARLFGPVPAMPEMATAPLAVVVIVFGPLSIRTPSSLPPVSVPPLPVIDTPPAPALIEDVNRSTPAERLPVPPFPPVPVKITAPAPVADRFAPPEKPIPREV